MAADLSLLRPAFRAQVEALLAACAEQGFTMRPSEGLRDPFVQARYWRQSRSSERIQRKIADLKAKQLLFLAHCLGSVGPQHGPPVTDAIPGLSWHQWGEAVDCFWLLNGKAEWSLERKVNGKNGYRVMATIARDMDLTAGFFWTKPDSPHIQARAASSPSKVHTLVEIDRVMRERFGS